jgi:uncharacterized protein YcbK (DUF882 family)
MTLRDAPTPGQTGPGLRADGDWRRRPSMDTSEGVNRRGALSGLAGTAVFALTMGLSTPADGPSVSSGLQPASLSRRLNLVVAHTGETFSDAFAEGDQYDSRKLARLNRLLRDYSNGEMRPIDPALFDVLARVQAIVGQPLRVLSGYRSWRTNRFMRIVGFDVAEHSQHVAAKAVDFMVPGVTAATLGDIARRCGAGGIGVYKSGFVHVDTGMPRSWTGN